MIFPRKPLFSQVEDKNGDFWYCTHAETGESGWVDGNCLKPKPDNQSTKSVSQESKIEEKQKGLGFSVSNKFS